VRPTLLVQGTQDVREYAGQQHIDEKQLLIYANQINYDAAKGGHEVSGLQVA
jgi:hypothetical protein